MDIVLIKSFADKPWRSPETYRMIADSLRQCWKVRSVEPKSTEQLIEQLEVIQQHNKDVFVFNIAEFIDEETQTGFIPEVLDDIGIPHLGSDANVIEIGLNKASTKERLQKVGVPTPKFFVHHPGDPFPLKTVEEIGYPLFAKPLNAGGHLGVSEDSIIRSSSALTSVVESIQQEFHQPVLVEAYIDDDHMREFSVGVVGNGPYWCTPVEIDFDAMPIEEKILSFDAAQKDLEVIKNIENKELQEELNQLALQTFHAVGARDYSRIDMRMDQEDCYVLEINTMPGLGPHSFLPESIDTQHGLDYPAFIQKLVEVATLS